MVLRFPKKIDALTYLKVASFSNRKSPLQCVICNKYAACAFNKHVWFMYFNNCLCRGGLWVCMLGSPFVSPEH